MRPLSTAARSLALFLLLAAPAAAQPWNPDHDRGWDRYREAVVEEVAGRVAPLADPDRSASDRAALRQTATQLFRDYQRAWERSPAWAWRDLSSRTPVRVVGLELSAPSFGPRRADDRRAFREAVVAEERAALAELSQPWLRARQQRVRPELERRLQASRDIYDQAWQRSPTEAWAALDLDRTVRALSTLRRRLTHERRTAPPLPSQVVVNPTAGAGIVPLLRAPRRDAAPGGLARAGDVLNVLRAENGWYEVADPFGLFRGWIPASLVSPVNPRRPVGVLAPRPAPTPTPPPPSSGITIHLNF